VQRRALRGRQVLEVGGARVACADKREDACPRRVRGGDQRLQRVGAEQRVGGEGVGAEAGDRAPRRGGLADQGLAVGLGGDRDVAPLAVGDDQQPRLAGGGAEVFERRPARCAEALEAGELRLDRDAGRPGAVDQRPAVSGDGARGDFGRRALDRGPEILPGQLRRVGVETEADLAAALFDERRQPVRKRSPRLSRP
jgi:hypothetical protein